MDQEYRELERECQATEDSLLLEKLYRLRKRLYPNKTLGFLEPWEPEWAKAWKSCPSDPDPETGEDWQYMGSYLKDLSEDLSLWYHDFRHRKKPGYMVGGSIVNYSTPATRGWYPKPRKNPEEDPRIKEVMEAFGFMRHPGKPGYWVEPYSGRQIRHRNLLRWARESPDLKKRIADEVGRLLGRRNPDESLDARLRAKLRAYSISRDSDDAVRFAEESLRSQDLGPKTELEPLSIAQYCLSDQPWWQVDMEEYFSSPATSGDSAVSTRTRIWDWIWERSNYRHRNGEEAIMFIRDPATHYSEGLAEETRRLLFPDIPNELVPVIDEAIKLGYEYLCFYA